MMSIDTLRSINTMVTEETERRRKLGLSPSEFDYFVNYVVARTLFLFSPGEYLREFEVEKFKQAIRNDILKKIS